MNPYTVTPHLRVFPIESAAAPEDLSWQDASRCAEVDPEIFFPEKGGSTRPAKRVCAGCEVRAQCLEYALEHEDAGRFGIWGGFSERERRRHRSLFGADTAAAVASVIPPAPQPLESAA